MIALLMLGIVMYLGVITLTIFGGGIVPLIIASAGMALIVLSVIIDQW